MEPDLLGGNERTGIAKYCKCSYKYESFHGPGNYFKVKV
jgi:hypothetical protein